MPLTVSITIPDHLKTTIGQGARYQTKIKDGGELINNPESLEEFIERKLKEYVQGFYVIRRNKIDAENRQVRLSGIEAEKALITSSLIES